MVGVRVGVRVIWLGVGLDMFGQGSGLRRGLGNTEKICRFF